MRNEKPKQWTEEEVQLLLKLAREGARSVEIASALERYVSSVKRITSNMGLVLPK